MTAHLPEPLRSILELARWAPSGDNLQPWRFEVLDAFTLKVHVLRETDVYDLRGLATRITCGVLLETIRLAASRHQLAASWAPGLSDSDYIVYDLRFQPAAAAAPDPLSDFIRQRSVDRRPYRLRRLSSAEKTALETSVQPHFHIRWHETTGERWSITRLNAAATRLRLTIPETFPVHQRIIDWDHAQSTDRVPAASVGLDPMTRKLMRWVMQDWRRSEFMNRYLAGPLVPMLEMDWAPGLACGAHFVLLHRDGNEMGETDLLAAGQALQRFWLTATRLGLAMQPAFATLTFSSYGEKGIRFSRSPHGEQQAAVLSKKFKTLFGMPASRIAFIGRIGEPRSASPARSTRRPLEELLWSDARP